YLLDQILKDRFKPHFKILDAGCGEGRNLIYFVRNEYQVYGIDRNADAIKMLKYYIKSINNLYPLERLGAGDVEKTPYVQHEFDAIISSAVLHFAENKDHFLEMLSEMVRVLKPGGILFARMATDVGMKEEVKPMGDGKYFLPDGSVRFLLTKELLKEIMQQFKLEFIEPFKTVVVDQKRSMSTLVLSRGQ
ncbi:MAG: class I SAM-dependent methyltransferase, partial [Cyclobacteriaceae bacterium]|nr:class I SAM-dependent methyltransferase [Cyclobacteriaceae bacterium]